MPDQLTEGLIDPRRKRPPMPPPIGGGFAPPEAPPIAPQQPDRMEQAARRLQEQAEASRQLAAQQPPPAKGLRAGLGTAATILGSLVNPQIGQMLNQKLLHPGRERWQQQMDRAEEIQKINQGELQGLEGMARVQDLRQNRADVNSDRDAARTDAQRNAAIGEEGRLRTLGAEDLPADVPGMFRRGLIDPANPSGALPQKVTRYAPGITGEQQVSPDVGTVKTVEGGGYSNRLVLPTAGEKQRRKVEGIKSEQRAKDEVARESQRPLPPGVAKELGLPDGFTVPTGEIDSYVRMYEKKVADPSLKFESHVDEVTGDVTTVGRDARTGSAKFQDTLKGIAKKRPPVTIGGLNSQQFSAAEARGKEFDNHPTVKDFNVQVNKLQTMKSLLDKPMGGPSDLAIVYEFMKALDPSSVVRESEYDTAAKSGNIFKGAMAKFNGYLNPQGGFLPPEVKGAFTDVVEQKLGATRDQVDKLHKEYSRRIEEITGQPGSASRYITNYAGIFAPKTAAPAAQLPQGNGKPLDKATAQQFYEAAGGDPAKARQLAAQNGWK